MATQKVTGDQAPSEEAAETLLALCEVTRARSVLARGVTMGTCWIPGSQLSPCPVPEPPVCGGTQSLPRGASRHTRPRATPGWKV